MQLTKQTDFAFRVLIYLGTAPESWATIQTIASDFSISKSHLMKVVQKLVQHGYVSALRGKHGGIKLAQAPQSITLRAVIEHMETTLDPINCFEPPCVLGHGCALKRFLWQANGHYLTYLEQVTLADILPVTRPVEFSLNRLTTERVR